MKQQERDELRRLHSDWKTRWQAQAEFTRLLDALDEALAEKEHYELLAEARGKLLDESERHQASTKNAYENCLRDLATVSRKLAAAEQKHASDLKAAVSNKEIGP